MIIKIRILFILKHFSATKKAFKKKVCFSDKGDYDKLNKVGNK